MKEIERKFLVLNNDFIQESFDKYIIKQGFISNDPERVVRIRIARNKGFLTIKGKNIGIERLEWEKEITIDEANVLLTLCKKPILEKTRFLVNFQSYIYEIDVFEGENLGLMVAELELENVNQFFEKPNWLGKEISDDHRYYNSNLVENPYKNWN
ncbi:MAG: CYTH domain-containing protein [Flavobacterium sp.]